MNYELKVNDVFEYKNNDYITLDKHNYKGFDYFFTNKLIGNEEPGKEFYVFKALKEGIVVERDEKVLEELYKIFSKNFNDKLNTILDSRK